MKILAELVGLALIVAFLAAIWPPLALLGAGALLVLWANVRPATGRTASALGVAVAAFTAARRAPVPEAHKPGPVPIPVSGWHT